MVIDSILCSICDDVICVFGRVDTISFFNTTCGICYCRYSLSWTLGLMIKIAEMLP